MENDLDSQKSQTRQKYILEVWAKNPFPAASHGGHPIENLPPEGTFLTRGRIHEMGKDDLILFSNGRQRTFKFHPHLELAQGFKMTESLSVGDFIEVLALRKQDLTEINGVTLLVPCRQVSPFDKKRLGFTGAGQWQKFIQMIRVYFHEENFIELRTPTLVPSPGLEPYLEYFETRFDHGKAGINFFLPTSPEFHLKKALTLGYEKCFEFKDCFRNNEWGPHHQPEFLMLEWYRAYKDNHELIRDLRDLLNLLQRKFSGPDQKVYELKVFTMGQLWKETLNFDLTPRTTRSQLMNLAKQLQIHYVNSDSFDDLFARLMLEKLEPALKKKEEPTVVWHFPPSQAALARLTVDGWADRFELYWKGFEIANAFHELNDVTEYRRRFEEDQKKKASLGRTPAPIDEELMSALEWGMPPSAGIALGVERLFMALTGIKTIEELRLFPLKLET